MTVTANKEIQRILDNAVTHKVTPGLAASAFVLDVKEQDTDFYAGNLAPDSTPVDQNTIYDLASLTKVVSTTLLVANAIDQKKLNLNEEPWPQWPGITLENVLNHTSGLPAWKPFYREALLQGELCTQRGKEIVVDAALGIKPIKKPGEQVLYSDIGFIALGDLLEKTHGNSLAVLFKEASEKCFGENSLCYRPSKNEGEQSDAGRTASTGRNPWLKHDFAGYVHDPNCYAMGGVSGHAGLFGTLRDVKKAVHFFLKILKTNGTGVEAVLRQFAENKGERALGFDKPSLNGSGGNCLSQKSVGHLGFTGTSFWVDPEGAENQGSAYVFLSNRVFYGTTSGVEIKRLRQAFHRAAFTMIERKLPVNYA